MVLPAFSFPPTPYITKTSEVNVVKQSNSKLIEQLQRTNLSITCDSNLNEKLERSEAQVRALQEQLHVNATEWGVQKTQMEIEITRIHVVHFLVVYVPN